MGGERIWALVCFFSVIRKHILRVESDSSVGACVNGALAEEEVGVRLEEREGREEEREGGRGGEEREDLGEASAKEYSSKTMSFTASLTPASLSPIVEL